MASEFEDFFNAPSATPSQTTAPVNNPVQKPASQSDFETFFNSEPDSRRLSYSVSTAKNTPVDQSAKVINLQTETGLPADIIKNDIPSAEETASKNKINYDAYHKDHPVVSQWVQDNPENASVSQNDLHNLGYLERMYGSIKNSYARTKLNNERSELGLKAYAGNITSEERTRIKAIDDEMAGMPEYGLTGVSKIPGLLVDLGASNATKRGIQGAAAFAGIGAAAGLSAGGVGAIPGAIGAAGYGMTAGFAAQGAMDSAAQTYLTLESQGVDRETALKLSTVSGAINGALNAAPVAKMIGIAPGLAWLQKLGVNKVLQSPTIMRAVSRYGFNIVENSGVMGSMSGMASLVSSISEDIGILHKEGQLERMSPGALMSTFFRDENLAKAKQATEEGALTGVGVSGITGGFGLRSDINQAHQAKARAEAFKEIGNTIANSEVYQKTPQKTQEIIQRITKDGPQENVFIPMEAWNTYWQEKKIDPREAAESVNGDPRQYDQALQSGTDIQIPMDKYAVTLAPTEHNAFFQNEIRTNPMEMNAREADMFLKEEMGKAQEAAKPGPQEEAQAGIRENITKQLREAGYDERTAGTYAQVYESAFGAMGERAGIDPLELYNRYGLNIQKVENLPTDYEAIRARSKSMATRDVERFDIERKQFDEWRDLLKAGVKPVADAMEEYSTIPNWAKNKNGRGLDEYRMEAIANGLLGENEDIFVKLRELKAPEKPKGSASFTEAATQEILAEKAQEKPRFFQKAADKIKSMFKGVPRETPKTETPEFKAWFGDSKVVDADGKPLQVYHGTGARFEEFDLKTIGKNFGDTHGFFFTNNTAYQESFYGKAGALERKINNDPTSAGAYADRAGGNANVIPAFVNIRNPLVIEKNSDGSGILSLIETRTRKASDTVERAKAEGYDGIIVRDTGHRLSNGEFETIVIPTKPEQIKSPFNQGTFDPSNPNILRQGERGFIQFGDKKVKISLLKDADLSTFLHETGHLYLNVMSDLAKGKDAPEQIKADYATIIEHIGAKDGEIKPENHEKFAQSFEQYLMDGKAPSEALKAPFARFRAWLLSVYRNVKQLVELKPEIREVFDRMLATDEEINAAQAHQDMAPLFADPKAYGLTESKAKQYENALEESRAAAEQTLMAKQMREIKRQANKDWIEERTSIRNTFAEEVDRRPEQLALAFLKDGKFPNGDPLPENTQFKLSREAIERDFKDYKLSDLRGLYEKDGGQHPDAVAPGFGYRTGAELLAALRDTQDRNKLLDSMADAKMKELHGDLMNRPELADAAMKAVHNTKRARVLQLELEHLASQNLPALKGMIRQMTRRIPRLEEVTRQAEETIRTTQNRNIYPSLFLRQEAFESRAAGEALAKGDVHGAFEAKQRELLNHELYNAASDWKDRQSKILNYFAKFDKESTRDAIAQGGRGGETYLEQIDALLEHYDIRKSITLKELSQRQDLKSWLQEQRMEKGYDLEIKDKFLDDTERMHWKDMLAGDLDDLYGTIKQIDHLARAQSEILYEGRVESFQKVKATLQNSIRQFYKIGDKEPPNLSPTAPERLIKGLKEKASEHMAPEFLFKELDGWEDNGPYWNAFFRPFKDAETNELVWREKSLKDLKQVLDDHYTSKEQSDLFDRIPTPEIGNKTLTKNSLLAMAANHGNRYNLEGMLEGNKAWMTPAQLQKLMENHMTYNDWQVVQRLADHVNSWWPMIAKLEKERNGIAPEKIEGEPFKIKTADGKVFESDGFYWPIKWDPEQDVSAKRMDTKESVEDMFGGSYAMAQTKQGHTKARTNTAGRPFSMDFFSVLNDHLSNMQHDLAYRDFVINSQKLINDPELRHDISSVQGKEGFDLLQPWLRSIAGEKMNLPSSKTEGLLGFFRANIAKSSLGFSVTSAVKQFLDVGLGVKELGTTYSAKGYWDVWGKAYKLKETKDFIFERDPAMAERQLFSDRDMRDFLKKLPTDRNIYENFIAGSLMFMKGVDYLTAMPIWMGAYRKAMEGKADNIKKDAHGYVNEKDAVAYAASVVRMSKGSFAPGDLSAVMRGSPAMKLFTMFYGPMNILGNNYNRARGEFWQNKNVTELVVNSALLWILPTLGNQAISGGIQSMKDDPLKNILEPLLQAPFETIVFARNIISSMNSFRGGDGNPFSSFIGATGRSIKSVTERVLGDKEELSDQDIDAILNVVGGFKGIPARRAWRQTEVFYDWMTGDYQPESVLQGVWDTAKGKRSD